MPLFKRDDDDFVPTYPALMVGISKGSYRKLLERSDPFIAQEVRPGETVQLYTVGFAGGPGSGGWERVIVVTSDGLLLVRKEKVTRVDLGSVRGTRLFSNRDGSFCVSLEPLHKMVTFLEEDPAQAVAAFIDKQVASKGS